MMEPQHFLVVLELKKTIQFHLYLIMAYLSGAKLDAKQVVNNLTYIEKSIQQRETILPKLIRFVLPQGSEQTARLHVARTIVRSAERRIVQYINNKNKKVKNDDIILRYLNRLSDLLFILARKYSKQEVAMKEV
ncbi:MAG: ATP/cobalamin adenosyltransferase [Candidatus Roizmanbacteria bacterium GW2011_GWA2_37_7]|uniref:Corrinoid adenosyltransferase n=1 Tax=Candidatus Roizmanbacteria bacterium GW2011_GWA2_37_7 TaxID=1618481 RepID=A0A0G0HK01_9BACT|nr:MAG: ATP/cobalamin adenosyltransferase [Candidatus Roizmanbacteria bacterium GW2011_GWA2_37_7]